MQELIKKTKQKKNKQIFQKKNKSQEATLCNVVAFPKF